MRNDSLGDAQRRSPLAADDPRQKSLGMGLIAAIIVLVLGVAWVCLNQVRVHYKHQAHLQQQAQQK